MMKVRLYGTQELAYILELMTDLEVERDIEGLEDFQPSFEGTLEVYNMGHHIGTIRSSRGTALFTAKTVESPTNKEPQ